MDARSRGVLTGLALALVVLTGGPASADTITGTSGPDELTGTEGPDVITARGGADVVEGLGGIDRIDGGPGADRLFGGADRDLVVGGTGQDLLEGGTGDDSLAGGPDTDIVRGGAGDDTLDGDEGDDLLEGGAGEDTFFGLDGADELDGGGGRDELYGGRGADVVRGGPGVDEIEGEEGPDDLTGGTGADEFTFFTLRSQPDARLLGEADVLHDFEGAGEPGGDVLRLYGDDAYVWVGVVDVPFELQSPLPGAGDGLVQVVLLPGDTGATLIADTNDNGRIGMGDFSLVGAGLEALTPADFTQTSFVIAGTAQDDVIVGTRGDDRIFAAGGDDRVRGRGGSDEVHGGPGNDVLNGGAGGFDNLFGDDGDDELTLATSDVGGVASGGEGDDVLRGSDTSFSNFDNTLDGGVGDDELYAGSVGSTANGGAGADRLVSGPGDDNVEAGRNEVGSDLDGAADLVVYPGTGPWSAEGSSFGDTVYGFEDGVDRFDLRGSGLAFADLTVVNEEFQTTITSARGRVTVFESSGQEVFVDASDFLF